MAGVSSPRVAGIAGRRAGRLTRGAGADGPTRPPRENPLDAGGFECAREDLNLHGPYGPQGPQPPGRGRRDRPRGARSRSKRAIRPGGSRWPASAEMGPGCALGSTPGARSGRRRDIAGPLRRFQWRQFEPGPRSRPLRQLVVRGPAPPRRVSHDRTPLSRSDRSSTSGVAHHRPGRDARGSVAPLTKGGRDGQ